MIELAGFIFWMLLAYLAGYFRGKSTCKHKRKYPMYNGHYCPDCEELI